MSALLNYQPVGTNQQAMRTNPIYNPELNQNQLDAIISLPIHCLQEIVFAQSEMIQEQSEEISVIKDQLKSLSETVRNITAQLSSSSTCDIHDDNNSVVGLGVQLEEQVNEVEVNLSNAEHGSASTEGTTDTTHYPQPSIADGKADLEQSETSKQDALYNIIRKEVIKNIVEDNAINLRISPGSKLEKVLISKVSNLKKEAILEFILFSNKAVEAILGVSRGTLNNYNNNGDLLPIQIGGKVYYRHEVLKSLIERDRDEKIKKKKKKRLEKAKALKLNGLRELL